LRAGDDADDDVDAAAASCRLAEALMRADAVGGRGGVDTAAFDDDSDDDAPLSCAARLSGVAGDTADAAAASTAEAAPLTAAAIVLATGTGAGAGAGTGAGTGTGTASDRNRNM
jgi:hypothetical protein